MGKIVGITLIFVLVVHSLAFLGILGFGLATNRFDAEKREQYLATWRGEKLAPPPLDDVRNEVEEMTKESSTRIMNKQLDREILTREMQQFEQLLREKQATLEFAQNKLQQDIEVFQKKQKEFQTKVNAYNEKMEDEGFKIALENYKLINPKLVKEDFMKMKTEEAVKYLAAMNPTKAAEILDKFKTVEEMSKRLEIMRLMEEYGKVKPEAGANAAAEKPETVNAM